jgi:spermidine/putrescine-binding protein
MNPTLLGYALFAGYMLGLAIKTFVPWLISKPRCPFKLSFIIDPVVAGAAGAWATVSLIPSTQALWSDLVLGVAAGYFGPDVVRKFRKIFEKPTATCVTVKLDASELRETIKKAQAKL